MLCAISLPHRVQVALHLHRRGDYAMAMDHWSVLLEADPDDGEAAYNAAVSMQYLGNVEDAAALFTAASVRFHVFLSVVAQVRRGSPGEAGVSRSPN